MNNKVFITYEEAKREKEWARQQEMRMFQYNFGIEKDLKAYPILLLQNGEITFEEYKKLCKL